PGQRPSWTTNHAKFNQSSWSLQGLPTGLQASSVRSIAVVAICVGGPSPLRQTARWSALTGCARRKLIPRSAARANPPGASGGGGRYGRGQGGQQETNMSLDNTSHPGG